MAPACTDKDAILFIQAIADRISLRLKGGGSRPAAYGLLVFYCVFIG